MAKAEEREFTMVIDKKIIGGGWEFLREERVRGKVTPKLITLLTGLPGRRFDRETGHEIVRRGHGLNWYRNSLKIEGKP